MRLKSFFCRLVIVICCMNFVRSTMADDYAYLTNHDPYYPHVKFPKLTTPQWVGEEGVDAVIVLAIDDMRDPIKYERYLRPILNRLKQIDGRAAVSIMTNSLNPKDAQLKQWLDEGLSLDVHTIDHPCPLLKDGDFNKAKSTYDRCVDLISQVKGNKPVAFRMPCCDSLNTVSPRFFAEIFNKTTAKGNYLTLDTSVFHIFSDRDPDLPKELLFDADGKERFRKYVPTDRGFVNTIENYPYPYIIGNLCWEFPCVAPSDWSAQHHHGVNNPKTVSDLKAALDLTVIKKGVFNLVFHPHGWIRNTQVVDLIDHAVKKHGKKVKFLTFREAQDRLNRHLLKGQSLRDEKGKDRGVRLVDLNRDGYMDVVIGTKTVKIMRIWDTKKQKWNENLLGMELKANNMKFGAFTLNGTCLFTKSQNGAVTTYRLGSTGFWDHLMDVNLENTKLRTNEIQNIQPIDLDGDSISELLVTSENEAVIFSLNEKKHSGYSKISLELPKEITTANNGNFLPGLRFIDINEDGLKDLVYSDHERYSVFLMDDMKTGSKTKVFSHKRIPKNASGGRGSRRAANKINPTAQQEPRPPGKIVLPPIVNKDGTNNGFFVHSQHLFWQNEHTAKLPHLVAKVSFHDLLRDIKPRAKSPEMSLKAMQPRPGFQVQLVAAEPLIRDPVAFEWGADGRLWVAEMADYPLGIDGKGKSGGRIRVLEDTNHDGVYDRSTVFLEGLNFPNGVMPWKKGVLITTAPDIIYAEDTNGDGKADVKKVLYTGFGEGNQQHRVNGLVYGLDHWLYCANGDSHGFIRSTKLDKIYNIRGRDLRIQPDSGKLDPVTGQTQFGRNRDDWGNWFGCNNSNPMFHFVLEDRYIRRNPYVGAPSPSVQVSINPGTAPCYPISRPQPRFNDFNKLNRFTSACGAMIYRDNLFGKRFAQNSFVSEPVHNLVHREILKQTGVTFQSQRADDEQRSEFLSSRDNWFRPTMLKTGPDGALYIADMYREHIEHPEYIPREQQQGLNLRNGHDKGRIYRIFPTGTKLKPIPNLAKMKTKELVAALDSSNGWQRDTAQRLLIERNDEAAVKPLRQIIQRKQKHKTPLARLHALCTLNALGKLDDQSVLKGITDKHPAVMRRAILIGETYFAGKKIENYFWNVAKMMTDADPAVRLQLAYSLGNSNQNFAATTLGMMFINQSNDKYIQAALMSSVNRKNLNKILMAIAEQGDSSKESMQLMHRLIGMAASMGQMEIVAKRIKTIMENDFRGIWTARSMASLADILDALRNRNRSFQSILEYVKDDKEWMEQRFAGLLQTADKIAFSKDEKTHHTERIAAIRLLSYSSGDASKFKTLFQPKYSHAIQSAAITALGKRSEKIIANVLLANWRSYGPSLRREVLETLLQKYDWVNVVLEQLQQKKMHIAEIDAVHRQRLLNFPNFDVREKAKTVFGNWKIDTNRQKVLAEYQSVLKLKGNLVNGRLLFNKHCAICHKLNGFGHIVGPDLAALKNKSSENLLVAMLDPNRNIESKYLNYVVVTVAGKSHQGLLTDETGGSVTVVAQEDKRTVIPRGEIDQLVSTTKSTMPEGLEKDLKPQDVSDIMAYLRKTGPTRKRKIFPGNTPAVVKLDAKGALLLTSKNCEIYGPSLILENKYANLGFWSSPQDEAIWTIDVPKSGIYEIEAHWALPNNAGGTILFESGAARLAHQVPSTGSWDVYKKQRFGTIRLKKGIHHFAARSQEKINGALIDLKSLQLERIIE